MSIQQVEIDTEGVFKYIQIKDNQSGQIFIRGYGDCEYHNDILQKFIQKTQHSAVDCIGGGRIKREGNTIFIYGYSKGFGRCDHQITVDLCKKVYPDHDITFSDDGY